MKRSLGLWALVGVAMLCAPGCGRRAEKPAPSLTATPEAVVLIQDAETLCVKIGKSRETRRYSLPPGLSRSEIDEAEQKYLEVELAPDLAVVDRAAELIDERMPTVRQESSPRVVSAIEELLSAEDLVCRTARQVRGKLGQPIATYSEAEGILDVVYKVPASDSIFARRKFAPILQKVRAVVASFPAKPVQEVPEISPEQLASERREWEKTQEFQIRQEAEHEAAVNRWRERELQAGPETRDRVLVSTAPVPKTGPEQYQLEMRSWVPAYTGKVGPVREALASYLEVRRGTLEEMRPACEELLNATTALVDDPTALNAPDPAVNEPLQRAYSELQQCAQACATGRNAEAALSLGAYQSALRDAAAALRPYSVTP